MNDLTVHWVKCKGDVSTEWCPLLDLNLDHEHFENLQGVYIIWNDKADAVRVGSGVIKDRITAHKKDPEVNAYSDLKVTWAEVDEDQMEGVEKYLADELDPEVGERFPDRDPISVNLPGW